MKKLSVEKVEKVLEKSKAKSVLVLSDGHIFQTTHKSFAMNHAKTNGLKIEEVSAGNIKEKLAILSSSPKSKEKVETPQGDKVPEIVEMSEEAKAAKIKEIEDFLVGAEEKPFTELKDFCKSIDERMPVPKSKAVAIEEIEKELTALK